MGLELEKTNEEDYEWECHPRHLSQLLKLYKTQKVPDWFSRLVIMVSMTQADASRRCFRRFVNDGCPAHAGRATAVTVRADEYRAPSPLTLPVRMRSKMSCGKVPGLIHMFELLRNMCSYAPLALCVTVMFDVCLRHKPAVQLCNERHHFSLPSEFCYNELCPINFPTLL